MRFSKCQDLRIERTEMNSLFTEKKSLEELLVFLTFRIMN